MTSETAHGRRHRAGPRAATAPAPTPRRRRRQPWRRALRRDWQLYSLAVLPLLFFAGLPLPADDRQRHRVPALQARRQHLRRVVGGPAVLPAVPGTTRRSGTCSPTPLVLGTLTLLFCFPLPIVLALLLNEVRTRRLKRFVQSVSYLPHFLSIVIVAAMVMQLLSIDGIGQPGAPGRRRRRRPVPAAAGVVPHHLRLLGGLADRRLGHDPLPGRAHHHRRRPLRGGPDRRRQPVAADLARDAAGHPADDGDPADPQHRHLHGGRVREDPAAVQPADVPDRRRHLHLPVPGRRRRPAASATPPPSACSRR